MTQRSKDFRDGFAMAFLVAALLCLAAAIFYDLLVNNRPPSPAPAAGLCAAIAMSGVAGLIIAGAVTGMHEPSKGEASNGRDDA